MFKLYGFPVSNYTNMVELALLEKGLPYEYVLTFPDQTPEFLAKSPRGKVPALGTPKGFISETNVILDYLEDSAMASRCCRPTRTRGRRFAPCEGDRALHRAAGAKLLPGGILRVRKCPTRSRARHARTCGAGFATLKRHGAVRAVRRRGCLHAGGHRLPVQRGPCRRGGEAAVQRGRAGRTPGCRRVAAAACRKTPRAGNCGPA